MPSKFYKSQFQLEHIPAWDQIPARGYKERAALPHCYTTHVAMHEDGEGQGKIYRDGENYPTHYSYPPNQSTWVPERTRAWDQFEHREYREAKAQKQCRVRYKPDNDPQSPFTGRIFEGMTPPRTPPSSPQTPQPPTPPPPPFHPRPPRSDQVRRQRLEEHARWKANRNRGPDGRLTGGDRKGRHYRLPRPENQAPRPNRGRDPNPEPFFKSKEDKVDSWSTQTG